MLAASSRRSASAGLTSSVTVWAAGVAGSTGASGFVRPPTGEHQHALQQGLGRRLAVALDRRDDIHPRLRLNEAVHAGDVVDFRL